MTKINVWKCDICQKEFREGDAGEKTSESFEILIPNQSSFSVDYKIKFNDSCSFCRDELINIVMDYFDSKIKN